MSKPPETLILERLPTPVGEAILVADAQGALRAFDWTARQTSDHAGRQQRDEDSLAHCLSPKK